MADTQYLTPPLFREPLVERPTLLMTPSWQRWLALFTQQAGVPGPPGEQGEQGEPGPQGPEGPQGDGGPTGATGATGAPGATGSQGPQGVPGTPATLGPTLTTIETLTGTVDTFIYFVGTDNAALATLSAYSRSLLAHADAGTWRSTLGLGTMSTQNANAVSISGGSAYTMEALQVVPTAGDGKTGVQTVVNGADGSNRWSLRAEGDAPSYFGGPVAFGDAATTRANLGLGTMSVQNATAVAITGGSAALTGALSTTGVLDVSGAAYLRSGVYVPDRGGDYFTAFYSTVNSAGGTNRWALYTGGTAPSHFGGDLECAGTVGMGYAPPSGISLRCSSAYFDYVSAGGGVDTTFIMRTYGQIYSGGTNYAAYPGPWVAYSDARMKTNIEPIPRPLETLCALRGVLYEWRDPAEHADLTGPQMGVIAQEVEGVLPAWVGELKGFKTTQLSRFEALTIEAVKALTARVAALEPESNGGDHATGV